MMIFSEGIKNKTIYKWEYVSASVCTKKDWNLQEIIKILAWKISNILSIFVVMTLKT